MTQKHLVGETVKVNGSEGKIIYQSRHTHIGSRHYLIEVIPKPYVIDVWWGDIDDDDDDSEEEESKKSTIKGVNHAD